MDAGTLISELRRRRVFRVLVGYGIVSFAVLQVVEPIMHALHLPDVTLTYVVLGLALGFPVAVVLAWAFDINEGRIERTDSQTLKGVRLPLVLAGIGLIAAAPGVIWYFVLPGHLKGSQEAATAILPTPARPSIAVLPFVNLSSDKEQEYFSDGIAEEILNALAQVQGLKVIGRTSSFTFKGRNEDLRSIGEKLNVANVLEGSVRKEGDRVRITAQLIEATGGSHLWSKTFDREMKGIFAVQDEIAREVVEALRVKLLPGKGPSEPKGTNPEAYAQFLVGRGFARRQTAEGWHLARGAYEKATALDPEYAPAWAGAADTLTAIWSILGEGGTSAERRQRALAAAERSIALAPNFAPGYVARANVRMKLMQDWTGAQGDLERASALSPNDTEVLVAQSVLLFALGRLTEAIASVQRATELDPLSVSAWNRLGQFRTAANDLDSARTSFNLALGIAPENAQTPYFLSLNLVLAGKPKAALAVVERDAHDLGGLTGAALAQHDMGRTQESQAALEMLIARHAGVAAYQIAEVYAWRGERGRAVEWLERAYVQRDSGLFYFKTDPFLRGVRKDPRYTALLKKMNLTPD